MRNAKPLHLKWLLFALLCFFIQFQCSNKLYAELDVINTFDPKHLKINDVKITPTGTDQAGASGVIPFLYNGVKYYVKEQVKLPEPGMIFDAVIASRVLNLPFYGDGQRFPIISLGINPNDYSIFALSEELKDFETIASLSEDKRGPFYDETSADFKDLGNLYVGLLLVHGGDPSPYNVMHSERNRYFGNIDLDVSFKQHVSSANYVYNLPIIKRHAQAFLSKKGLSFLALREFKCTEPCQNFLYATDSHFETKLSGEYKRFYNQEKYGDKRILSPISLLEAMAFVTAIPLDDYKNSIKETIRKINYTPPKKRRWYVFILKERRMRINPLPHPTP